MQTKPLPKTPERKPSGAVGKKLALVAWLVGILAAALAGLQPDPYLASVRASPPPHPYPIETVGWVVLLVSAHVLLLLAVLRPGTYRRSWGRALAASILSAVFSSLGVLGAMHSPPPWVAYLLWLVTMLAGTLLLLGHSVVAAARARVGT